MRTSSCLAAVVEELELRRHLAGEPSVYEQYFLQLVNRARANPTAEAAQYGFSLNEGVPANATISSAPKQPLAFDPRLNVATDGHNQWMLANNTFSHTGAGGSTPMSRDQAAGYVFTAPYAQGENIGYSGTTGSSLPEPISTVARIYGNLFVDSGIEGRGHRVNILADYYRQTGVAVAGGAFVISGTSNQVWMLTQDFATTAGNAFITGVAYADTVVADGQYSPYEGFGGVSIEATSTTTGMVYRTTSWDTGGYSLQVPPGTYNIIAVGGDMPDVMTRTNVSIGDANVQVDFNATNLGAMAKVGGGVLSIPGTIYGDQIRLTDAGEKIAVAMNAATWFFSRSLVSRISVTGGLGDDLVDVAATLPPASISGDSGADTLSGTSGADTITGGDGNDVIFGRVGNDLLSGDIGRDSITGGPGDDTISGGQGRDTLVGGEGQDWMGGGKMDDYLDGKGGNDTLVGGLGADTLVGGDGNDTFLANDAASDTLDGGAGFDSASVDPLLDSVVNIELR